MKMQFYKVRPSQATAQPQIRGLGETKRRLLAAFIAVLAAFTMGGCNFFGGGGPKTGIDVAIAKAHVGTIFTPGQNGSYTLAVSNGGTLATTGGITVTDTLPTGLAFVSAVGTNWACGAAGQVVTCTNPGPIASGAAAGTITLTVAVANNAPTSIMNTATVATAGDVNAANNSSTDTVSTVAVIASNCGASLGNEAKLKGQYAILMHGFQGSGNGTPEAIAGSFNANGLGVITSGEEDINNSTAETHSQIQQNGSFYTLGADFRGCLQLTNAAGTTTVFRISVQVGGAGVSGQIVSKGRIIEDDDAVGNGTGQLARAAGILQFQDPTSFSLSKLLAQYAFGLEGVDSTSGHIATGGSFTLNNATGVISAGFLDTDDAATLLSGVTGATGTIVIPAGSANGRGTLTYLFTAGASNFQITAAIYMVNASEFFMIDTDAFATAHGITSGRAIATGNAFTGASLSGNFMVHATGSNVTGGVLTASETLGLVSFTPTPGTNTGTVNGTLEQYASGGQTGVVAQSVNGGTFTVSANSGRVTLVIPGLNNPPVLYLATDVALTDHLAAFAIGTDSSALFGAADNQPVAVYNINSVITAAGLDSFVGTEDPGDNTVTNETGAVAIGNGTTTFTNDESGPVGLQTGVMSNGGILINANGTGNVGVKTFVVTNGTKLFILNGTGGAAVILVVEMQ